MKVKELIEKLKELDQDREIYYINTEFGYNEEIGEIIPNCIFRFKHKGNEGDIFIDDGYDNYERIKKADDTDEIIEYKEIYLIK